MDSVATSEERLAAVGPDWAAAEMGWAFAETVHPVAMAVMEEAGAAGTAGCQEGAVKVVWGGPAPARLRRRQQQGQPQGKRRRRQQRRDQLLRLGSVAAH